MAYYGGRICYYVMILVSVDYVMILVSVDDDELVYVISHLLMS